jgi:hypothetical protein
MSQQAVRQATRRSALDAQAVFRRERANRERRLERLAADDDRRRRTVVARGALFRGRRNHPDRMRIPAAK